MSELRCWAESLLEQDSSSNCLILRFRHDIGCDLLMIINGGEVSYTYRQKHECPVIHFSKILNM